MGISSQVARAHIDDWEKELNKSAVRRYKAKWPKYLFRHEKLENAAKILIAGQLLSRDAAANLIHDDIAPASVITRRSEAHHFSRLYFRPKNPTQIHIEGIRQIGDLYSPSEIAAHAPVLIMLVFNAASVLTLEETCFSDGNMQHTKTIHESTDDFFGKIPFKDVYHDESFQPNERDRIIRARCAEVLAQSPLNLSNHLTAILCRSEAERKTLLHLVPALTPSIKQKIRTISEVGVFFNDFTYVKEVDVSSEGLSFLLNPRKDNKEVVLSIEILNLKSNLVIFSAKDKTISPSKRWRITHPLAEGSYQVTIELDGHLAYRANSTVTDLPF